MAVQVGYVPTAEQMVAQQARRAAQAAEKAARKLKHGGKTVRGAGGKYISVAVTENQVAAKQAARQAQKAKAAARYGGKTIADPTKPGKFISQSAKEVEAAATAKAAKATKKFKLVKKEFLGKAKGFLGKVKNLAKKVGKKVVEFSKTKKGKIAIAAAAVLAIAGIVAHNKAENAKNNEEIRYMQVKGFENLA